MDFLWSDPSAARRDDRWMASLSLGLWKRGIGGATCHRSATSSDKGPLEVGLKPTGVAWMTGCWIHGTDWARVGREIPSCCAQNRRKGEAFNLIAFVSSHRTYRQSIGSAIGLFA